MTKGYEVTISKRLLAIAGRLPKGCVLADIGSDHALLPVYAVQQGIASRSVAGELNEGPFQAASRQVVAAGLADRIEVRRGDGLAVLNVNEASVITIAGMGGSTIRHILDEGISKLAGVDMLVLQPNVGESIVREWLQLHRWLLLDELILEEDELFYEVLIAVPAATSRQTAMLDSLYEPIVWHTGTQADQSIQLIMGPHLLRHPTWTLEAKWIKEIAKMEWVVGQIANSKSAEANGKREQLLANIARIKEVLACLRTDKR